MDELLGAKASPSIEMVWGREEFGKFIDWMGLGSARERRSSQRHLELLPTSNTLDDAWNIFRIPVVDWGSKNCEQSLSNSSSLPKNIKVVSTTGMLLTFTWNWEIAIYSTYTL